MSCTSSKDVEEGSQFPVSCRDEINIVRVCPVEVVLNDLVPRLIAVVRDQVSIQTRLQGFQQTCTTCKHPYLKN